MDSKKVLEELENKYKELANEYQAAKEEIILFEEEIEYAEYESKTEEERKSEFPTQYAMYEKQAELSQKIDDLSYEILQAAQNLHKDIEAAIGAFKERIEQNIKARDELEQETVELRAELKELKKTPEYKNREQAVLEQAYDLQTRLKRLATEKGKLTRGINMFQAEINKLEETKNELVAEYGEQVMAVEEQSVEQENDEQSVGEQVVEEQEGQTTEEQKEIQLQILSLEKDIEECTTEYHNAMKEIRGLDQEIMALKATEEYKKGDEVTRAKVERMEQDLVQKVVAKNGVAAKLRDIRNKINQLESGHTIAGEEQNNEQESSEQTSHQETVVEAEQIVDEIVEESVEQQEEQLAKEQKERQFQILSLEKDIEECTAEYHKAMKEIRELDQEIMALKATEEYKKGDEVTLAKVERMEQDLVQKVVAKNGVAAKLRDIRNKINQLESGRTIDVEEQNEQVQKNYTNNSQQKPVKTQVNKGSERRTRTQPRTQQTVYAIEQDDTDASRQSTVENIVPETESIVPEIETKCTKKEFNELCAKVKKGKLTQEEFSKLAEIMKDEQNYDRLGISTGVIFNKSKSILKAMAKITADTGKTARLSRERLGLAADRANEENGYLSTSAIKEWKGLKTLMDNPGQKIASEELFKKVVELNRESLTDEQKEVCDRANEHLSKFNGLKSCLYTYQTVSEKRREKSWLWSRKEEAKTLPEAANTPPAKNVSSDLEGLVKDTPDDSEIKPRETSVREQVK